MESPTLEGGVTVLPKDIDKPSQTFLVIILIYHLAFIDYDMRS